MASSNRHWPSMFKSKPCNHHQWQHDINSSLISTGCHRASPFSSGCEERSPEPKPRWNPKPEQIRILEAIFNSGMVNPPREEIRKIRAQLQEYGQVGDANVFYWFQNRKSRSKHKQRHLQNKTHSQTPPNSTTSTTTTFTSIPVTAPSSSSSSSDKSSSKPFSVGPTNVVDVLNSPTGSVNQQPYFHNASGEYLPEQFFIPVQPPAGGVFGFPEMVPSGGDQTVGGCSGVLLTDLMMMNNHHNNKKGEDEKMKVQHQQDMSGYTTVTTTPTTTAHTMVPPVTIPSTVTNIGGVGEPAGGLSPARSTVFINDVAFDVAVGPFNVRDAFGEDAVLIHSSGQPVLTNEWGVTLQSLQHGAFYYLVRTLTTSHGNTFDLVPSLSVTSSSIECGNGLTGLKNGLVIGGLVLVFVRGN